MALSQNLHTTGHPPCGPLKPTPRLRVAFNRETNFLLSSHYHQQQHLPAEQSSMQQQQQQHTTSHNNEIETISTNSTTPSTPLIRYDIDDDLNISPKTKSTRFDLKFHDPRLYHAISTFDTETPQARYLAADRQRHRQRISLGNESPQCRHSHHQIPQGLGLKVWNGFSDTQADIHHYSNEYIDGLGGGAGNEDRSRKRRRITGFGAGAAAVGAGGIEKIGDDDMADA